MIQISRDESIRCSGRFKKAAIVLLTISRANLILPTMSEHKVSLVICICVLLACFTFLTLALRLWARGFVVRSVGADDCKDTTKQCSNGS